MDKRNRLIKDIRARWQLYLLLLLPLAYIILFKYVPMGGIVIAFKDYDFSKGIWGSEWVGLYEFKKFIGSYKFKQVLENTLAISLYQLLVAFPMPIVFALLLNAFPGKRYKKIIQTTTYMPHFISTVVMVGIVLQILNARVGLYGNLYRLITGEMAPDILAQGPAFRHVYVWSGIWQGTGYGAIIYIAALQGVDSTLHEAALIDGASRLQRIRYIDIPCILPTVSIMLVMQIGNLLDVGYEKTLLLQNDLNLNYSEIISTYVYKVGLSSGVPNFPRSTAVSLFNNVINFILLIVANKASKKISGNGLF